MEGTWKGVSEAWVVNVDVEGDEVGDSGVDWTVAWVVLVVDILETI